MATLSEVGSGGGGDETDFQVFRVGLGLALVALLLPATTRSGEPIPVDVELVIAVDISYSMDYDELALQRGGYVAASPRSSSSTR